MISHSHSRSLALFLCC